jgi:hypothetical protein
MFIPKKGAMIIGPTIWQIPPYTFLSAPKVMLAQKKPKKKKKKQKKTRHKRQNRGNSQNGVSGCSHDPDDVPASFNYPNAFPESSYFW